MKPETQTWPMIVRRDGFVCRYRIGDKVKGKIVTVKVDKGLHAGQWAKIRARKK